MKRIFALLCLLLISVSLIHIPAFAEEDLDSLSVIVASETKPLKQGDKGEAVRSLQTRLRDLKYYLGKVDGVYGKTTANAIKKLQKAYKLKETGNSDRETLNIIYGDSYRPLQKGDEGKDVSRLQTRLSELGYFKSNISGRFQLLTRQALMDFQKNNGMEENGIADVFLQEKLYSDDVEAAKGEENFVASKEEKAKEYRDLNFPGDIAYGTKSDAVRQVQDRLRELGYFKRKSTGGYYRNTQAALRKFQQRNGVHVKDTIDEATWNALYASDAVGIKGEPKPTPVPEPAKYALGVDVKNQLIRIYERDENGEYTKFDRAMWCSTGTKSFPSTVGTFTLTKRRVPWAEFPTWGGGKARYWTKITEDIAFHSVIYSANDVTKVNMKSVRKLGQPASHGCIRLTLQDAKWIYQNCGPGTQVTIYEDGPKDPELKVQSRPGTYDQKLYAHPITPAPESRFVYDASNPPSDNIRQLKKGAKGEDVYWLQYRLKELGFMRGTPTGEYLDGTADAVSRYRIANKLGSSKTADIQLLRHLYDSTLKELAKPTPMPTDVPQITPAP